MHFSFSTKHLPLGVWKHKWIIVLSLLTLTVINHYLSPCWILIEIVHPRPHLTDFLLKGRLALPGLGQLYFLAVEFFLALSQAAQDVSQLPAGRLTLLAQRLYLGLGALLLLGCLEGKEREDRGGDG